MSAVSEGEAGTIDFRILGPVEAYSAGRRLALGGGKQRSLLAVLLVHAGETVSVDRLIDALWGEDPPASAANSVHVYVSQLRKALGPAALETRGHGYALAVPRDAIDARRFERLLGRAREERAQSRPEEAMRHLSAALALWRGPPLAELAYEDFARGEIERLTALRLSADEQRFDVQLELGLAAELVPELEELVRTHPERERFRAQLMLALYRSGRQADALEVYRDGRRRLAEELGLDPSPELQRLEHAILNQDPELILVPAVPSRPSRARRDPALAVVAGAALMLVAAVGLVFALGGRDDVGLASVAPNSVGIIDPETGRILGQIPVGNTPSSIAAGAGSVWVISADDRTVSQIDSGSRRVVRTVSVNATPTDVVAADGAVWVGGNEPVGVTRLDARSGAVTHRLRFAARSSGSNFSEAGVELAVGFGSIWAAASIAPPLDYLARIDPATASVTRRIRPVHVGPIAIGSDAVWLIQYGTLTRVDPAVNAVSSRRAVRADGEVAADDRWVWVAESFEDIVWRVDARGRGEQQPVQVGTGPSGIALGFGSVWVSSRDGTVSRIDPVTRRVIETIRVGQTVNGIAIAAGVVWVTVG